MRQYNISPSLIKDFINYVEETGYEKDGVNIPFVDEEKLLRRINRYPEPQGEPQKKGIDFEAALLGGVHKYGFIFDVSILARMNTYLPKHFVKQLWVEAELKELNTIVGGYCDVVGEGKVIDIKTTSSYQFPEYINSPQLLYLLALKEHDVKKMEFLITNFSEVFKEDYHIDNVDFSTIYSYIERLQMFLDANESKILNLKVLGRESEMPWLPETVFNMFIRSLGSDDGKNAVKKTMMEYRMKTVYREKLIDALFNQIPA